MWTFLLGLFSGFAAKFLWDYKNTKKLGFTARQYAGMAIWLGWVVCGGIFVITSLGEFETRAASLGGIIFGVVAIAGLVIMRSRYLKSRAEA